MNEYKNSLGFEDPFAGTPKATTNRSYDIDNTLEMDKLKKSVIFEENGLMGMKDAEGNVLCAPEFTLIEKCIDYVFFLTPQGSYKMVAEGCEESGYMQEENRPFVAGMGKVGFKVNGRMVMSEN